MKLYDMAHVVRSKNSGPFAVTLDILFDNREAYERMRASGAVTPAAIARLYHIPEDAIMDFAFFDAAMGVKITYLRTVSSGTVGDRDVYGAQQHAPLMTIDIP